MQSFCKEKERCNFVVNISVAYIYNKVMSAFFLTCAKKNMIFPFWYSADFLEKKKKKKINFADLIRCLEFESGMEKISLGASSQVWILKCAIWISRDFNADIRHRVQQKKKFTLKGCNFHLEIEGVFIGFCPLFSIYIEV